MVMITTGTANGEAGTEDVGPAIPRHSATLAASCSGRGYNESPLIVRRCYIAQLCCLKVISGMVQMTSDVTYRSHYPDPPHHAFSGKI